MSGAALTVVVDGGNRVVRPWAAYGELRRPA